ncbi:hypothetical protein ACX1C1_26445 [Paenibacillus sp. strain BS8-2]
MQRAICGVRWRWVMYVMGGLQWAMYVIGSVAVGGGRLSVCWVWGSTGTNRKLQTIFLYSVHENYIYNSNLTSFL